MATGDALKATKAYVAAAWAAVLGFVAPGVTYLLTVDDNGITGREWLHAALIAVVVAGGGAAATGATVWRVENKPKTEEIDPIV
jgi:hypothetical protein